MDDEAIGTERYSPGKGYWFSTFSVDLTKQSEIRGLLQEKSRSELQVLAKRHNIDGRLKSVTIIEELVNRLAKPVESNFDEPREVENSAEEVLQPPLVLDDTAMNDDVVNTMIEQRINMQDLIHLQRLSGGVFSLLNRKDHDRSPAAMEARRQKQLAIKEKKRLERLESQAGKNSEANTADAEKKAAIPLMVRKTSITQPTAALQQAEQTPRKETSSNLINADFDDSPTKVSRMTKQIYVDRRTMDEAKEQERKNSLNEVTLKDMLITLIQKQGFDTLFKATALRCFDTSKATGNVKPTIGGALKLLRQPEMAWARRRIEDLYLREMSPSKYKKPPQRISSGGDDQYKYGVQSSGKKWERKPSQTSKPQ